MDVHYEPLPSMPEDGGEAGGEAGGLHGAAAPGLEALLGSEQWQWEAIPNLDQFFTRIYRYWEEKGFAVMLTSRVLNLLALLFTVGMSALLLLYVNWGALQADCLRRDTCDIWEVAIQHRPLSGRWSAWTLLAVTYLALFSAYWVAALAHLVVEVRDLAEIKHFCNHKLGISERQMGTITWPEVAHRLVQVQRTRRLCAARDLTEHDIVSRVMRKENYLIGMLNKGVLALNVPIPGLRRHLLLSKTLEWNLYWCILDAMFDERSFRLKPAFVHNEAALQRRLRVMALCNLAAAPFLLVFLLIYFFMKNAEKFYHHPSSVGARRWSPLAQWRLREFNELPHFIKHRLNASHKAAEGYIQQFPSAILSHAARFVAFVAGSIAALLLVVTLIDERLLERDLFGRQLVWWMAVVGMVVALSRAFVIEAGTAFDPEAAMMEVVAHTHYLPRHWRSRAHTREVREQFEALFQFKALLFLEELASILLTPLLLWFSLPQCAGSVLSFVERNTSHIEGVGDVCSLAAFDFQRHGNARYGAPATAPKLLRSRQGKLEKSFLSFAATYPEWEPDAGGQQLLQQLAGTPAAAALAASTHPAQPLLQSVLLQQAAGAAGRARGPARQQQPGGSGQQALRRRQAALAAALGGRATVMAAGSGMDAGGMSSSLFGSAELPNEAGMLLAGGAPAGLAASLALPAGGTAELPLDRVSASQLMLQSLYEQRSTQQEQLPQVQQQQQHHQWRGDRQNGEQQPLAGLLQHPLHHPRAMAIPGQVAAGSTPPAAASPSPQQRALAQAQQALAGSPRQPWLGRSPSGRSRVSEQQLSVLSRENSTAGAAGAAGTHARSGSALGSPALAAAAATADDAAPHPPHMPLAAGGAPGLVQGRWQGLGSGQTSLSLSPPEEEMSDSLLLLLSHGQPSEAQQGGGSQHSAALHAGHSRSSSDGPPQFF